MSKESKQSSPMPDVSSAIGLYTKEQIDYVNSVSNDQLRQHLLHQVRLRDNMEADRNAFEKQLQAKQSSPIGDALHELVFIWEEEVKKKKEFEERAKGNNNDLAAQMWRHKYEGMERAANELKKLLAGSSPIGDVEQAAKWKELVEDSKVSYAYLFAGSKLTIEDWHKIYDNAFFLFTEWLAGSQWASPRPEDLGGDAALNYTLKGVETPAHPTAVNCEANHIDINELLAEFNRRGFNTENWDGDEGAEKAIVDGVCNYLEERQEKLFDQITEQHIEINKLKNQQKQ